MNFRLSSRLQEKATYHFTDIRNSRLSASIVMRVAKSFHLATTCSLTVCRSGVTTILGKDASTTSTMPALHQINYKTPSTKHPQQNPPTKSPTKSLKTNKTPPNLQQNNPTKRLKKQKAQGNKTPATQQKASNKKPATKSQQQKAQQNKNKKPQ